MAYQIFPIVFWLQVVFIFVLSFMSPVDGANGPYTNYTVNGWTVPVCPLTSFCNMDDSCSISYESQGGCHCDPYCFYFQDCCIDYFQECKPNVTDDQFMKAVEGINPSQFTCELPLGNPQYLGTYLMVSQCDERWSNEEIKANCEDDATIEDALTLLPVEYLENITFKNVYCAVCNFKNLNSISPWGLDATCLSEEFSSLSRSDFSAQQLGDVIRNCLTWQFLKPFSRTSLRICERSTIESCDVDPENDTMVLLAKACDSYKGIAGIYKNPHCSYCHNALVNNISIETTYFELIYMRCPPFTTDPSIVGPVIPFPSYPVSVLFDFSSVEGLSSQEPPVDPESCRDDQIFDQFNNMCSNLTCPSGYGLVNLTCQRLPAASQCSLEDTIPILIEVECKIDVEDASVCHSDTVLQDYVMSTIDDSYQDTLNLSVSRFVAQIQRSEPYTVCTQTLDIQGYVGIKVDVSKENLDTEFLSPSNRSTAANDICGNMTYKISIGCSSFSESCPNRVVSEDNFTKSHNDKTGQVLIGGETKYYLTDSLYTIEYDVIPSAMNSKRETFQACVAPPACTLVSQNISLFMDLDNGSYIYSPLNITLAPNEYIQDGNNTILICSYVLQRGLSDPGFLRFTSIQSIISIIGMSLSIIALVMTFITYLKFNLLRKATSSSLIMSLCVALILAQFFILFNGLAGMNSIVCLLFAIVSHYMWIAVFSHATALAFDLHRRFGITRKFGPTTEGAAVLGRFLLFAWGCPIVVILPCLGIYFSDTNIPNFNLTYGTRACWIGDGLANLYVFGIPVACLIFVNVFLFSSIVFGLHRMRMNPVSKNKSNNSTVSSDLLIYVKMSTLLGFTWLFGFVAAFADVTALWYIFIILNSLQGVYIFIAFVCNKRVFKLWRESCSFLQKSSSTSSSKSRGTSSDELTSKRSQGKIADSESML